MTIRLTKPWIPLDGPDRDGLPAQLGVFQLGDAEGRVLYVGYAGGREPFGIRTALASAADRAELEGWGPPVVFRHELTHGYLSRWEELLMVHVHDHGDLPVGNQERDRPAGRLAPDGGRTPATRSV